MGTYCDVTNFRHPSCKLLLLTSFLICHSCFVQLSLLNGSVINEAKLIMRGGASTESKDAIYDGETAKGRQQGVIIQCGDE